MVVVSNPIATQRINRYPDAGRVTRHNEQHGTEVNNNRADECAYAAGQHIRVDEISAQ